MQSTNHNQKQAIKLFLLYIIIRKMQEQLVCSYASEGNGPTNQVKINLRDQDGNLLASGRLDQRTGSAIVNTGSYAVAKLNPGESLLTEPITFAVPASSPYRVIIEAVIDNTYYHYNKEDQVTAPGMKQTIETTITEVPYTANARTDKGIYKQGETITITGQAISTTPSPLAGEGGGEGVPNVPVKIGLSVSGFDRYFTATTDTNGNFSYTFTPGQNEAGTYSVWAIHPDLTDRTVQAQFIIVGLSISPKVANITIPKGQSYDIPVTLANLGGPLTGLTFTANASGGITSNIQNQGSTTLAAGERRTVTFHITAGNTISTGYGALTINTNEGITEKVEANVSVVNALPIINTSPSYIDTGLVRGTQKIQTFNITNTGLDTLKNARLEGPSTPWLSLTVDKTIGDIGVNQSKTVGIVIKPEETIPQGVYNDRITIYADNHIPYTYNIQVTVTSNAVGNVLFDVLNELMEDVPNAAITFQHQQLTELVYNLKTAADGTASQFDIPEGRYSYNITAPGHKAYGGSFTITPGITTTLPTSLELNMVNLEWSVVPTTIQDKYEIKVTQTFETNVPTPVLIMDPPNITIPQLQPGQVFNGEFKVTNYGLIAVTDVKIDFPTSFEDYDIELLIDALPQKIGAMEKITIPYRITRRVQTAQSNLMTEVLGYGGTACIKTITFTVRGTCVICPNTAFQRIVEKFANMITSIMVDCPPQVTTTTYPITQNVLIVVSSGGQTSTGTGTPTQPATIQTSNPCECKNECDKCDDRDGKKVCMNRSCTRVDLTSVDAKVNGRDEDVVPVNKSVSFTANPVGENCEYQYLWNFGDGGTSTEASPSHTYTATGEYTVQVTVRCKKCSPPEVKDTVKVVVSSVKLCKRDLNLCDVSMPICFESRDWEWVNPRLHHAFIYVNGKTFGLTTDSASFSPLSCIFEGNGVIERDLWLDQAAEMEGYMNGSCQAISCPNANALSEALMNATAPYYCLMPNSGTGNNCQEWAAMMIGQYCSSGGN